MRCFDFQALRVWKSDNGGKNRHYSDENHHGSDVW
jgi:hypothetical protein